jgi:hypothetical protein
MLLRAILGPQLVLAIAGARTPGSVASWAQGRGRLSALGEVRLRIALELALLILEEEGLEAARGWIVRRDSDLGGRSPLGVLDPEPSHLARRQLVRAASQAL